jgi:hypothetical protein
LSSNHAMSAPIGSSSPGDRSGGPAHGLEVRQAPTRIIREHQLPPEDPYAGIRLVRLPGTDPEPSPTNWPADEDA